MSLLDTSNDLTLLNQYAQRRDADAFGELVRRYAAMVYATCLRITRNQSDAEDAAQDCFLELARRAGTVRSSVPAWLHATARSRALMGMRSTGRRRQRELAVRETAPVEAAVEEPGWDELRTSIDEALAALPDELRAPLVMHYLAAQPQAQVAQTLGISQSTVSSRIGRGIELLRGRLAEAGVTAPALALTTGLAREGLVVAPADLTASAMKLGLSGIGQCGSTLTSSVGVKLAAPLVALLIVVAAVGTYLLSPGGDMNTTGQPATAASASAQSLAELRFQGDIYRQDSFSMAMQAAARHFGKQIKYEEMLALSGNAFAPALRPGEPERSFWAIQGGGRNIDLVCRRLGLIFRPFPRPEDLGQTIAPKPTDPAAIKAWEFESYRKPVIAAVRDALARGELILSMGEFLNGDGVTWTEWGIVTEARDDGTIWGAASNGRLDNRIDFIRDGWFIALDPAGPSLSAGQAQREVLRRAALRIRGDVVVKTETYERNIAFGAPAMDAWIASMDNADFCPMCKADPDCALHIALPSYAGARSAATWLAANSAPEAANHYLMIAEFLKPYADPSADTVSELDPIRLGRTTYLVEVLTPGRAVADMPEGDASAPYPGHLMPYYNIHTELADEPSDALAARIQSRGLTYEEYWQSLPSQKLAERPLAFLATRDGRLAGYIRFYPGDRGTLRALADRQDRSAATLVIGGCAFTLDALNGRLDSALLDRVIQHARRNGYRRIQAVGWPDIRSFAMWGEGLRRSAYEAAGFRVIATEAGDSGALRDQLGGAHGPEVQALAHEDTDQNADPATLAQLRLVQLDVAAPIAAGYADIIGDVAMQQEHARAVLAPVKQELLAAADAMERAMASAPVTTGPSR
jgi:RNA polymerase sigma factor (sigma-70 family)